MVRDFAIRLVEGKARLPFMCGWIFGLYDRPRDPLLDRAVSDDAEEKAAWLGGYDMAKETISRTDKLMLAFIKETVIEWD